MPPPARITIEDMLLPPPSATTLASTRGVGASYGAAPAPAGQPQMTGDVAVQAVFQYRYTPSKSLTRFINRCSSETIDSFSAEEEEKEEREVGAEGTTSRRRMTLQTLGMSSPRDLAKDKLFPTGTLEKDRDRALRRERKVDYVPCGGGVFFTRGKFKFKLSRDDHQQSSSSSSPASSSSSSSSSSEFKAMNEIRKELQSELQEMITRVVTSLSASEGMKGPPRVCPHTEW